MANRFSDVMAPVIRVDCFSFTSVGGKGQLQEWTPDDQRACSVFSLIPGIWQKVLLSIIILLGSVDINSDAIFIVFLKPLKRQNHGFKNLGVISFAWDCCCIIEHLKLKCNTASCFY